jgi:hypothetical protein
MGTGPKSAFELAMQKLESQDKQKGESAPRKLTKKQKEEIAEARSFTKAKLAEREILHNADLAGALEDPDKAREIEENYLTDRKRLESDRDAKIARIKA